MATNKCKQPRPRKVYKWTRPLTPCEQQRCLAEDFADAGSVFIFFSRSWGSFSRLHNKGEDVMHITLIKLTGELDRIPENLLKVDEPYQISMEEL